MFWFIETKIKNKYFKIIEKLNKQLLYYVEVTNIYKISIIFLWLQMVMKFKN